MIDKYLRIAKTEDVDILVKFARHFHQASEYRNVPFSAGKVRQSFLNVINGSQLDGIILVALQNEKPVGMICGAAASPLFSEEKVAMELAWWVEPKSRKSKSALLLFKAYEDWAYRVGCSHVQSAYLADSSDKFLDDFYKRNGYKMIEVSYLKGVL